MLLASRLKAYWFALRSTRKKWVIFFPVQVLISGGTTLADFNVNRSEAARFPESEVVMLDANHWPLTETPDDVREAIDDWVGRTFGEPAGVPADRRS